MPAGLQPRFAQRITLTLPAALQCRVSLPHQLRSFDAGKTTSKASPEGWRIPATTAPGKPRQNGLLATT